MDFLEDILGEIGALLQEMAGYITDSTILEDAWSSLDGLVPAEAITGLQEFWPLILVLLLLFALVQLFELPLKLIWNGLIGAGTLFVVNVLGSFVGFSLKITLWKALIAGFLGIPGTIAVILYEIYG